MNKSILLFLSVDVQYCGQCASLYLAHLNGKKEICQITTEGLKLPTALEATSWLFTSMTEESSELRSNEKQLMLSIQNGR